MAQFECLNLPESPRAVSAIGDLENEETKTRFCRKTVAFRLDESSFEEDDCVFGKVKVSFGPPRPELTPEERELLYWTKKHFKSFKKGCKKLARTTDEEKTKHKVYLKTLMDVYSNPPDEEKIGIVHSRDTTCLPLATASVRGLERYIFPGLLQDQARVKESVLKAQAKLPPEMSPQQKAFVLASTSTILSRQSRRLARVIGHADSIVALSIYKSTFLPKKKEDKNKSSSSSSSSSTSTSSS